MTTAKSAEAGSLGAATESAHTTPTLAAPASLGQESFLLTTEADHWAGRVSTEVSRVARASEGLLLRVVFKGAESGGVLQDYVGEHFSFENKNDLVMAVESSPTSTG